MLPMRRKKEEEHGEQEEEEDDEDDGEEEEEVKVKEIEPWPIHREDASSIHSLPLAL